mmetsp:Transcript_14874/g.25800  ORF Transcript_14874/g.25800 Transcript_14874/m.25800 type:complete len:83 (-) Transcript_14874:2469-2717(-)
MLHNKVLLYTFFPKIDLYKQYILKKEKSGDDWFLNRPESPRTKRIRNDTMTKEQNFRLVMNRLGIRRRLQAISIRTVGVRIA